MLVSATQPLWRRAEVDDVDERAITDGLQRMFRFFRILFADFPPRTLYARRQTQRPVILYTDASSSRKRSGLGFVFLDGESSERLIFAALVPPDLLTMVGDRGPIINLAELLAVLSAVLTLGVRLRDRGVVCFVDNTTAMSWAIHGTVNNPEASDLAHALHLALGGLGGSWFFDYVPSAANIADIPSREFDGYSATDLRRLRELGAYRIPMRLPTADQLQDLTCFLTGFQ